MKEASSGNNEIMKCFISYFSMVCVMFPFISNMSNDLNGLNVVLVW